MSKNMVDKNRGALEQILDKRNKSDKWRELHVTPRKVLTRFNMQKLISLEPGMAVCKKMEYQLQYTKNGDKDGGLSFHEEV